MAIVMREPVKIKILIVVPTLECGGAERNVSILCNNIDTSKFDVTLAVLNNADQFFQISNKAVSVLDLGVANVRKSLGKILRLSKNIKPDIILSTANHLNLLFAIFRWRFPKNIKVTARESSIVSINSRHAKLPWLYNRLLKLFYRKLDLIVCQSLFMQEDLVKHYDVPVNRTRVIYNPVEPPQIASTTGEQKPMAQLITVARLSKEKGLDRLIRAVALLNIPYRFTIIGEGAMRPQLQQLINALSLQEKVLLAGNNSKPFEVVPNADLFLMGSYYEGFPNALLEAMAAGIPAVAFHAPGGIDELLRDHTNGLLVKGDSNKAFARTIEDALASGFDGKEIKAFTLNRFNVKPIMEQWQQLFIDIVN